MSKTLTQAEYLKKIRLLHGSKYDLSRVRYVNAKTPITVVCPLHGPFETSPSHFSSKTPTGFYYLKMQSSTESFFKAGITNSVQRRIRQIKKETLYRIELLYSFEATRGECLDFERSLFSKYDLAFGYIPKHLFAGSSECFAVDVLSSELGISLDES